MQRTLDQELEQAIKELFLAFGKNPKYEKEVIKIYLKRILNYYELLDISLFEETCEVLEFSRNFLPTLNEIADCYDFLQWCRKEADSTKKQRLEMYKQYINKTDFGKNNAVKSMYFLSKHYES